MKVTGVMNEKDFLQIYHEMPALRDLDISEVNITSCLIVHFINPRMLRI